MWDKIKAWLKKPVVLMIIVAVWIVCTVLLCIAGFTEANFTALLTKVLVVLSSITGLIGMIYTIIHGLFNKKDEDRKSL